MLSSHPLIDDKHLLYCNLSEVDVTLVYIIQSAPNCLMRGPAWGHICKLGVIITVLQEQEISLV